MSSIIIVMKQIEIDNLELILQNWYLFELLNGTNDTIVEYHCYTDNIWNKIEYKMKNELEIVELKPVEVKKKTKRVEENKPKELKRKREEVEMKNDPPLKKKVKLINE